MYMQSSKQLCNWCEVSNKNTYQIKNSKGKFNNRIMCIYCINNKKRRRALYKLRNITNENLISTINNRIKHTIHYNLKNIINVNVISIINDYIF